MFSELAIPQRRTAVYLVLISVTTAICFLIRALLTLTSYLIGESAKFLPTSQLVIVPFPGHHREHLKWFFRLFSIYIYIWDWLIHRYHFSHFLSSPSHNNWIFANWYMKCLLLNASNFFFPLINFFMQFWFLIFSDFYFLSDWINWYSDHSRVAETVNELRVRCPQHCSGFCVKIWH